MLPTTTPTILPVPCCFTMHKLRVLPWHTLASLGPVARHNARHGMRLQLHNSYGYVMHAVVMHVLQHVCVCVWEYSDSHGMNADTSTSLRDARV